ncbi:carbohydrate ABC transporter permease [Paenibacillus thalictri]|uniref:Sugar ABC transporter permease n=1 Tax=Paenibacillus thalictri TaxID=2527873 RepID=A0A4Q9DU23_9BACL|nr:sugar ABC transporter permease [Paenibacillus thalictri]TBL80418.1 sugar ABC transporter permease [Paenibacillus thalictri]
MLRNKLVPYTFLFPAFVGLLVFKLYPILDALIQSFYAPTFITDVKQFIGLRNYTELLTDSVFWNSVKVTLLLNIVINPLQIALAFLLAMLLNRKLKGIGVFRGIHIVPISVSVPIACILWAIMLNPEQGLVNTMLVWLGFDPQPFLASKHQALWTIILIATWKGVGYWSIFLLAGLQEISPSLYEAASIDGAGKTQQFRNVTFPMLKRTLTFVAVADTVANFLLFAPMYILTRGGPENSTNVLMNESFNRAFVYSDMGKASAIIIMLLLMLAVIITLQFKFLKAEH